MKPTEHKTVQSRILEYAQEVGWTSVPRREAELRRGKSGGDQKAPPSLFFNDLLIAKVRELNPIYSDGEGALLGSFKHLHTDIYGNREFVDFLRFTIPRFRSCRPGINRLLRTVILWKEDAPFAIEAGSNKSKPAICRD